MVGDDERGPIRTALDVHVCMLRDHVYYMLTNHGSWTAGRMSVDYLYSGLLNSALYIWETWKQSGYGRHDNMFDC